MSKRTFRVAWPSVALGIAALIAVGRAGSVWDVLRATILGLGVTAILLTVLLAVSYEVRYRRGGGERARPPMVRPIDVWGMGWSWILLLGLQLPQLEQQFGKPPSSVLLTAIGVSVTLALYWLDRMVVRQIQGLTGHR
jgi:drug/metabolite transporter (DMT)-like permease